MKSRWTLGALAVALLLGGLPVHGQQRTERTTSEAPPMQVSFTELQDLGRLVFKLADQNNDNQISQQEATDAATQLVGGIFFRADQNGDGVVSQEEAHHARDAFLATRPWLKYVVETAKTTKPAPGATTASSNRDATISNTLDTNNDKKLEASEVRQAVTTLVQAEFAMADTNRDGQLSPSEINAATAGLSRQLTQTAFQQADTDQNGQVSQTEFEKAILVPTRVAFRVIDLNHDGQISEQEADTARQVLMSNVRALNVLEPANSPRSQPNPALGSPATPTAPPAPPAPSAPSTAPSRPRSR
jgi:Ca2+-binding EF-hand superfamily protein